MQPLYARGLISFGKQTCRENNVQGDIGHVVGHRFQYQVRKGTKSGKPRNLNTANEVQQQGRMSRRPRTTQAPCLYPLCH